MEPFEQVPGKIGAAWSWSAEILSAAGVEQPENEARILLGFVLGIPVWRLCLEPDRILDRRRKFWEVTLRRAAREPLAYIVGEWGFHEIVLGTDARALIPRPETELLVETALELVPSPVRCLDVCCGSGAVALALATVLPRAWVGASDISAPALSLARSNSRRLGLQERVEFRQGDLFHPWQGESGFDLITANPPYVKLKEWQELEPEIREYEPALALQGGEDGLALIRRVVKAAQEFLRKEGVLLVEIGADQEMSVAFLVRSGGGYVDIEILRDLNGRGRVLRARRRS